MLQGFTEKPLQWENYYQSLPELKQSTVYSQLAAYALYIVTAPKNTWECPQYWQAMTKDMG